MLLGLTAAGLTGAAWPDSAYDIQRSRFLRYSFCMEHALGAQWWERHRITMRMTQWGVSHPDHQSMARAPKGVSSADARCRADNQIANADVPGLARDMRSLHDYLGQVRSKIKDNLRCDEPVAGNLRTHVEIEQSSEGTVKAARITHSSGSAGWDRCVIEAIYRASPLPREKPAPGLEDVGGELAV